MKNVEEQAECQALTDDLLLQYLRQHPDFFIRHSHQTETLRIPHPVRGSVSLVEWQLARQRNRIQYLEEEIALLTEQATRNEELFSQLLPLQMA
ncbi:DUF484 family protein, partial [Pectobacterium versatile]|nr:DUF484 family protein [Pectobacterium versatile]